MSRDTDPWSRPSFAGWRELLPVAEQLQAANHATLQRQIDIARIAAPTGEESRRADAIGALLRGSGCTVRVDEVGNVHGTIVPPHVHASVAPVTGLAHLDTVFDADTPLHCTVNAQRVHCPGISDNGRGLAAMLALADILQVPAVSRMLKRPIDLVATVGEEGEGNLRGAKHYFDRRDQRGLPCPVAVMVLDGPGDATIVHHAVGSLRLRVRIVGGGGHSWVDYGTPNPVHAMAAATSAIAKLGARGRLTVAVTVSRMHGGESLTSIPKVAWFDLDLRSTNAAALAHTEAEVHRLVYAAVREESAGTVRRDSDLHAEITVLGARPCGSLDAAHPLVRLAAAATRWQRREPVSAAASTDANVALARGIPAITIGGGGDGGAAHSLDEWYDNTDGMRGVVRAMAILVAIASD